MSGIREFPQEPIPLHILEAARLRFKRQIAAALIAAMAEEGTSFDDLDVIIGQKPGHSLRFINKLITGKARQFDIISDLFFAMGKEPVLEMRSTQPREAGTLADANSNNEASQ